MRRPHRLVSAALLCAVCGTQLYEHPIHVEHLPESGRPSTPFGPVTSISSNTATAPQGPVQLIDLRFSRS